MEMLDRIMTWLERKSFLGVSWQETIERIVAGLIAILIISIVMYLSRNDVITAVGVALITTMGAATIVILVRNVRLNKKSTVDSVAANAYVSKWLSRRVGVSFAVIGLSVAIIYFRFEQTIWIIGIMSVVYIIYPIVTLWRIKRGFFGTNASEAEELIRFILTEYDSSGGAGTRRSILHEDEILKTIIPEIFPEVGQEGAR